MVQLVSPNRFHWNRYDLAIPDAPASLQNLRFLHLTDLHLRPKWLKAYDILLQRVADNPPAAILFTGDFVENKCDYRPALPVLQRLFGQLLDSAPVYAILGNHDGDLVGPHLQMMGVHLIERQRVLFPFHNAQVELIGLPGVAREDLELDYLESLPRKQPGTPRIVLGHFPDQIRKIAPIAPDIHLAGHTHGGQVCLPLGIPLVRHDSLPRKFCSGVHRINQTWLIVNRGFGFSDIPLRIFCPAEVIEFSITPSHPT